MNTVNGIKRGDPTYYYSYFIAIKRLAYYKMDKF